MISPVDFDGPSGNLLKLTHYSSVTSCLTEFDVLMNCLDGLLEANLLSCFISGLKMEVRREVLAQQPQTISQAARLTRLQEDKLQDIARSSRPCSFPPWHPNSSTRHPPKPNSETLLATKLSQGLLPKPCFLHLFKHELDEGAKKVYVSIVTNDGRDNISVALLFSPWLLSKKNFLLP